MTKYMKPFDWILAGFLVFVWATVSIWLWYPYTPLTVHCLEILNTDKTVQQGGVVAYRIKWTKNTDKSGVLVRYYVNGTKINLDGDGLVTTAPRGDGDAVSFVHIPDYAPVGQGRIQWSVSYRMNPLRVVDVTPVYSDSFKVVRKK